ncbi:hypothetical protein SAMN05421763_11725 [[Luteovulum] sphaeroides subsp. megalophilum]|uniref:hypothetical protein n=1 Tax=Cereibacter sphaeroides TaxID=1063 RepID=UPI0002A3EE93|nr:hypothetical protein [Cereibacter sphaeroides]EKX56459.1 hypothetical protein D516_2971 [Rhodobacter sp. AKP1]SNT42269.1 hypothetical protein SAMN05421763_11725 [[Luteovulum] sphaeroides subsp. megalophilum]
MAADFVTRAERIDTRLRKRADQIHAAGSLLDAVERELAAETLNYKEGRGWLVADAKPFHAAPEVWKILAPTVRRVLQLRDEATGTAQAACPAETNPVISAFDEEYVPFALRS